MLEIRREDEGVTIEGIINLTRPIYPWRLGAPLVDDEAWQGRFSGYFGHLPGPVQGESVFHYIGTTNYEAERPKDYDLGGVIYYCQETGRALREFTALEVPGAGDRRPKVERLIEEFEYKPIQYSHPVNGQELNAEEVETRVWEANTLWRKGDGVSCKRQVIVFDEDWSPGANKLRKERVLEESLYKEGRFGLWTEFIRTIVDGEETYFYLRDDTGLMVHTPLELMTRLDLKLAPDVEPIPEASEVGVPENLGKARYLGFHK